VGESPAGAVDASRSCKLAMECCRLLTASEEVEEEPMAMASATFCTRGGPLLVCNRATIHTPGETTKRASGVMSWM
jgi:hypothetical protein